MATLSAQDLFELSDQDVKVSVTNQFILQLQNSRSVRPIFFNSVPPAIQAKNIKFVDSLACAFVSSCIGRSSLYGFANCVNETVADNYWKTNLSYSSAIAEGQSLYSWAFPDHCKSANASFRDYLNDGGQKWAQNLAAHVTTDPFINDTVNKLLMGQANWLEQLNLVFYKLYRLDSTRIDPVINKWKQAFPDKGIIQNWQNYNFVPAANFADVANGFLGSVNNAISVSTVTDTRQCSNPVSAAGIPPSHFDVDILTYGLAVQEFLRGSPSKLGLTTNNSPDNVKGGCPSLFGCFVAGTPVQLADGSSLPIEQIKESHIILTKDGKSATHSDESVVQVLSRPIFIYGIDDGVNSDKPFFSGGHLFHTPQGWKAIEVDVAHAENPGRVVGKLSVGDVVYRIKSVNPFVYEETAIKAFTVSVAQQGEKLFGLHLVDGHRSYHAHNYLVGMNYPVMTAKRLKDGFQKLTPHERRHLAEHLKPVFPLIEHALGKFSEIALREALTER
jgi:hypothetical protein